MLFTKILWGSSALYDGISSRKNASDLRQVRRVQREGEALVCHEGRGEGDAQLLPAGGDTADQLDVACALRGQIGGLREALSGGIIELDVSADLGLSAVADSGEIGGGGGQSVEVLTGDIELGSLIVQRIGGIQFGEVLCADLKRGSTGAVHSGDEHSDVLVVGQVGSVGHGKDTGELDTQIVPVADLVADLDFDGVTGAGTAAAQHGSSARELTGEDRT